MRRGRRGKQGGHPWRTRVAAGRAGWGAGSRWPRPWRPPLNDSAFAFSGDLLGSEGRLVSPGPRQPGPPLVRHDAVSQQRIRRS
jgi:hypothetical protein